MESRSSTFELDESTSELRSSTFELDESRSNTRSSTFALDESTSELRSSTFELNTVQLRVIGVGNWSLRRDKSRLYMRVLGLSEPYCL
ncbi:hypothetical protein [Nostoc sp.]|uniref:hypothetical protein n=1 Tax=Nostoc sp. TaxID=1180 RepID=UPI002FF4CFA2